MAHLDEYRYIMDNVQQVLISWQNAAEEGGVEVQVLVHQNFDLGTFDLEVEITSAEKEFAHFKPDIPIENNSIEWVWIYMKEWITETDLGEGIHITPPDEDW